MSAQNTRVLPFGDGVGGRYSLWSTVGLSIALALGWGACEELLEGAAEMDRHVRLTDGAANVALLAAFSDLFYTQVRGTQSGPAEVGCGTDHRVDGSVDQVGAS